MTGGRSRRWRRISTPSEARDRLEDALARLAADAEGLAAVSDGLARLRAQPDLAWRSYAGALLAGGDRGGLRLERLELRHLSDGTERRGEDRDDRQQAAERAHDHGRAQPDRRRERAACEAAEWHDSPDDERGERRWRGRESGRA